MENNNIDLELSSDNLSVDAILAEYDADKGAAMPQLDTGAPSAGIAGNASVDGLDAAEIKSETAPTRRIIDDPEEDEDYPNRRHSLSEVMQRASKQGVPSYTPARPGLSVDDIVLMAKMDEEEEQQRRDDQERQRLVYEAEQRRLAAEQAQQKLARDEAQAQERLRRELELIANLDAENKAPSPTSDDISAAIDDMSPIAEPEPVFARRSRPTKGIFGGLLKKVLPKAEEPDETDNEPIPTMSASSDDIPAYSPTATGIPPELRDDSPTSPPDSQAAEQPEPSLQQIFTASAATVTEDNPFASLMGEGYTPAESKGESPQSDAPSAAEPTADASKIDEAQSSQRYAKADDYEEYFEDELQAQHDERTEPKTDIHEKLIAPFLAVMAANAAKREKRRAEAEERRLAPKKELPPELSPAKASMLYAQQSQALRLRCIAATILTAVLVYLSYGLPAGGLLGASPTIKALVCLIMMLTVMVIGLDIFTNGFINLKNLRPGAESLIVISAFVSTIDAIYIAITVNTELGLPFCGVSALSMTFALWGSKLNCDNFALSFFTAAKADSPTVILSESGLDEEGSALAKSKRPVTGFVRTAENSDVFEYAYRLLAPVMLAGCLILSLFCFVASKQCTSFIHTLGASVCICASLSSFFGFALPFSVSAKRLARSGVAIAGYSGCAELGRLRRVIVSDSDIFPARTISVADISIAESVSPQKVIAYTGSMISAAGMCTTPVFMELMRRNGCVMQPVEDFACHEGGGIIARINGDHVYVGTASFMRLMGVRMPSSTPTHTCVYTAINDSLAGFFSLNYTAVASVQRALVMLLSGSAEPVFAIRDFNITPQLIKQKFRLPSIIYDFPSFADRYKMSAPESEEEGVVSAMYTRGGLGAVSGLTRRGRQLYIALKVSMVLSVLGSFIGMVLMLALCWSGSFGSASCGNIMTYMLLWLVPSLVISFSLRN